MGLADFLPALFDSYFIKLIFLVHAVLISMAAISIESNHGTTAYVFYNSLFLITVLLAILVEKSADIVLIAALFNGASIVLDILLSASGGYVGVLATLFVIMNMALRLLTTVLLLRNYSARAGVEDPTGGFLEVNVQSAVPRARSAYQNIDEPNQTLP